MPLPPPSALLVALACALPLVSAYAFDSDWALRNIHLAGASYCDPQSILDWDSKQAVDDIVPFAVWTNSSLQFYTAYDAQIDAVVVSVRGSEDVSNWVDNLEAWCNHPYDADKDICIMHGFREEYTEMRDALTA